jgi:nicotinamidase-related amidase
MTSRKYTLVVIDMQPYFRTSLYVVGPVLEQVTQANRQRCPVLFVEYDLKYYTTQFSSTRKELLKAASKSELIIKDQDDGSEVINEFFLSKRWPRDLHICGVNTDACVYKTVKGLYRNYRNRYRITVIKAACATTTLDGHNSHIEWMANLVTVV